MIVAKRVTRTVDGRVEDDNVILMIQGALWRDIVIPYDSLGGVVDALSAHLEKKDELQEISQDPPSR